MDERERTVTPEYLEPGEGETRDMKTKTSIIIILYEDDTILVFH